MKAIIGIDAGHGGNFSGTYGINTVNDGLFEKDFALEQALMIERKLLANGFKVIMSRQTDINPGSVSKRAELMAKSGADFALSVHFNGFENSSANGSEVYVPYAEKTAGIESGFLRELKKYFAERKPFARSNSFYNRAEVFDKKLNLTTRRFDAAAETEDYFGFIRTCWQNGISADLLEICFLTNAKDFAVYQQNKEKIADGIARSIVEGFGEEYTSAPGGEEAVAKPKIKRKPGNVISKIDVIN